MCSQTFYEVAWVLFLFFQLVWCAFYNLMVNCVYEKSSIHNFDKLLPINQVWRWHNKRGKEHSGVRWPGVKVQIDHLFN